MQNNNTDNKQRGGFKQLCRIAFFSIMKNTIFRIVRKSQAENAGRLFAIAASSKKTSHSSKKMKQNQWDCQNIIPFCYGIVCPAFCSFQKSIQTSRRTDQAAVKKYFRKSQTRRFPLF